ncbi:hypothetical protein [Streptomyces sp. NPDC046909]|uniref:hypothetical protein n=1 Tax=Streptomyces sp. NPDC046909 TaxID=3155617 RepID=UPI0033C16DE8
MSDTELNPEVMPADASDSIRAEVAQEYAGKLARAELKTHAAQAGISLPDGFTDYLEAAKLLGEDGKPSAEAIEEVLAPFKPKEPTLPQLAGAGHNRGGNPIPEYPRVSLDARHRK